MVEWVRRWLRCLVGRHDMVMSTGGWTRSYWRCRNCGRFERRGGVVGFEPSVSREQMLETIFSEADQEISAVTAAGNHPQEGTMPEGQDIVDAALEDGAPPSVWTGRHQSTRHFEELFAYEHLPAYLQEISKPVHDLALAMVAALPDGPELSTGLRKLREAKDCFVTAKVIFLKREL